VDHAVQGRELCPIRRELWFYVMEPSRPRGADWTVPDVLTPLLLGLLGAAVVYGATHLKLSPRARLEPIAQPA